MTDNISSVHVNYPLRTPKLIGETFKELEMQQQVGWGRHCSVWRHLGSWGKSILYKHFLTFWWEKFLVIWWVSCLLSQFLIIAVQMGKSWDRINLFYLRKKQRDSKKDLEMEGWSYRCLEKRQETGNWWLWGYEKLGKIHQVWMSGMKWCFLWDKIPPLFLKNKIYALRQVTSLGWMRRIVGPCSKHGNS